MVAVKRLDKHATIFDFDSELQLAKLQHINLVRLLGWCVHGKERIFVYEFLQNGSLDHYISGTLSLIGVIFTHTSFNSYSLHFKIDVLLASPIIW
jgi:hypothetical protein